MSLPDPSERPLLTVEELVALVPALGRSAAYDAVRRGELPSVRYGRKVFVPVAALRRQWGIDPPIETTPVEPVKLRAVSSGPDA